MVGLSLTNDDRNSNNSNGGKQDGSQRKAEAQRKSSVYVTVVAPINMGASHCMQ